MSAAIEAEPATGESRIFWAAIFGVALLALAPRLYGYFSIPLINSDGTYYIEQAKALYFGHFGDLTRCLNYLSTYPFFIAAGYALFGDWVIAARTVSVFFAILCLFPLSLLTRRFFKDTVAVLSVLIFALLPDLVSLSHEVIRGPIFWFFSLTGLYLFVLFIEKPRIFTCIGACLCFILGALTRLEGLLFIFTALIYLLFGVRENRGKYLLSFLCPFLVLAAIGICYATVEGIKILELVNLERLSRPIEAAKRYGQLRQFLENLLHRDIPLFNPLFFDRVRKLVWLIALGALADQIVETLFYFFSVVMLLGVVEYRHRLFRDKRVTYLAGNAFLSLFVLYAQTLFNWSMTSRFALFFILPAFIFVGAGIEMILRMMRRRFEFRTLTAALIIALFIFSITFAKNFSPRFEKDKLLFRQVGEYIGRLEEGQKPVTVAGAFKNVASIQFYANLQSERVSCFNPDCLFNPKKVPVVKQLGKTKCDYLIWDEKNWNAKSTRLLFQSDRIGVTELKQWKSKGLGTLVLYRVNL